MFNDLWGPVSIFPALCIIVISLVSVMALSKTNRLALQQVKYEAFDGLKGYLSMIVFISHSSTWFYYLHHDKWVPPPSNIYGQFGQSSINIFFMMTGFLFFNKLMQGKTNWLKLYISRIIRLFPVYCIAIVSLFIIVGFLSHFQFNTNESWLTIASQIRKWFMFTLKDAPNINGIQNTGIILCNVTWTLRYEWIFYLALPALSVFFYKNKPDIIAISITLFIIFFILPYNEYILINFFPFVGGVLASLLLRSAKFSSFSSHKSVSILILVLVLALAFLPAYEILPFTITILIFILIACGNTVFGTLSGNIARKLGQLSYGIYLFQGIIFFIFFKFILGFDRASLLSSSQHWFCIFLLTPVIVLVSFILHIYVEMPAMQFVPVINKRITGIILTFKQKIVSTGIRL